MEDKNKDELIRLMAREILNLSTELSKECYGHVVYKTEDEIIDGFKKIIKNREYKEEYKNYICYECKLFDKCKFKEKYINIFKELVHKYMDETNDTNYEPLFRFTFKCLDYDEDEHIIKNEINDILDLEN